MSFDELDKKEKELEKQEIESSKIPYVRGIEYMNRFKFEDAIVQFKKALERTLLRQLITNNLIW